MTSKDSTADRGIHKPRPDTCGLLPRPARRRRRAAVAAALAAALLLGACDSAEERKQSHFDRGLELVEAGEPDRAFLEFTNALRIDSAFVPAHRELGRLHLAAGRPGPATGHFREVIDREPEDLETRLALARILLDARNVEAAGAQADAALDLAPDDPRALELRASVDLLTGDMEAALTRARAALAADPAAALARLVLVAERVRAEDPRGALALLEAAPASAEDDLALDLIRIQILEGLGDRAAVGDLLRALVDRQPDDVGLRLALVRWHLQGDPPDLDAAEAGLRAAADLTPDEVGPRLQVVDFLRRTRGEPAARAELEALIAAGGPGAAAYERALALAEAAAGERDAAIARLEGIAAREDDPEAADAARLLIARLLDGPDAADRRAALVDQVLSRDPANAEALAMRAEAAIRDDRAGDAILDLRTALEQAPRDPALLELLALAHEREGDAALAAERRALAVQASNSAPGPTLRYARQLLAENRLGTAEAILLDALARAPREPRLLAALAEIRLRREDYDGAREATLALEALGSPDEARRAELMRAATLFGEGRTEETLSLLEEGWRSRGDALDMEALARAYAGAGEMERADDFLAQVLADNPDDVRAMQLLAEVRAVRGEGEAAEALLRRALEVAPADPGVHLQLWGVLEGAGRTEDAAAALEAGLAAAPDDPRLRMSDAMRRERDADAEGAIAVYERLYAENPDDLIVSNNLASLLSDHREDAESLERAAVIARRLRGSPIPALQDTYGWTLHLTGENAQAVAVLREAAPQLPDSATAQYHLGMAYAAIGQDALALEQLERALTLAEAGAPFPHRTRAEAELARLRAAAPPAPESDG